jgi:predicted nucleic acid-binding protein
LILVDSSGWIELFTDGPLADAYEPLLVDPQEVVTPTLVLHEVYKVVKRGKGEEEALIAAAQLAQTRLVPLTESLALLAADLAIEHRLATADSIVYATALSSAVDVATSDADFEGLPHVRYFAKR